MSKITAENFEKMNIVKLVEYIQKKKKEIKNDKEELIKYFQKMKEEFQSGFSCFFRISL